MATKIYKKGNYIYVVDGLFVQKTGSAKVEIRENESNTNVYDVLFSGALIGTYAFADILDIDGNPYSSVQVWEDYADDNTNFNPATAQSVEVLADIVDTKLNGADGSFLLVNSVTDLPTAVANVITLLANVTYYFTTTVDLLGDRIVCGANTVILGASSENCILKSTGLSSSTALITSVYSLPIRNITFTHGTVLNLDGDGTTTAIDWFGVNFTDCATVGTIKDYTNVIGRMESLIWDVIM